MEWYFYPLAVAAGLLAGVINTLAGSGSLVTLPLLVFLGLPANVANGTNRIGAFFQCITAFLTIKKNTDYQFLPTWWIVTPAVVGAILGAQIAVDIDEQTMNYCIGGLMLLMLPVIVLNPKKWIANQLDKAADANKPLVVFVFFIIGIYGGFIQAGVGIFLLAGLVMVAKFGLLFSNAVKIFVVLIYSVPAIIVFIINDQVDWELGLLVASGQALGGWIGARFTTGNSNAAYWIRLLLITIVIISIAKFFGVFELL